MEIIIAFLLFLAVVIVISGLILQFSARLAGVLNATLGESVKIIIYTMIITAITTVIFGFLEAQILGEIIGLVIGLYIITKTFNVSFLKAFLIWIFNVLVWFGFFFLMFVIFIYPRIGM